MSKVLVTGASGFIGNYVVNELLQRGHNVIATSAHPENAGKRSWFAKVTYRQFDFRDFDPGIDYHEYFDKPDLLIHLAWEGLPNYLQEFHLTENLPRHSAFLENLIRNGLKDITVTGTCFEYGMKEGCLSEDMECEPANAYAKAKDELRKKLQQFQAVYSIDLKWVRLFYMYGDGQGPNSLIPQLEKAIKNGDRVFNMSPGDQTRDFLPVEEVAGYIVTVALQNHINGVINCCSGKPVTVKEFAEAYVEKNNGMIMLNTGYYPYAAYEPMHFWGDNKKIMKIMGLSSQE